MIMAAIIPLRSYRDGHRAPDADGALKRLADMLADDLEAVNQLILQKAQSHVPLIPELAGHIINAGGKRLRPLLTLACARLCGYEGQRHRRLAACIEFIHTATLLHDDVVDASLLRRGLPTANAKFGNQASVLVGDFLLGRAFQLMVDDGSLDVFRILSNAAAVIAEGEVLQITTTSNTATSEQAYLDVVRAKTGELFAAACRVGAIVAGRPSVEEEALRAFGLNLGIAYQIADDVLDYAARQQTLGKTVGDDFREGKITLPVILAVNRGSEDERGFWKRVLDERAKDEDDFAKACAILQKREALRDALERSRHYAAIARDALGVFHESAVKAALLDIVDFSIKRGF